MLLLFRTADGLHQSTHIAKGIQGTDVAITRVHIAIACHRGYMLGPDRSFETNIVIGRHRGIHVYLSFIMKCFLELKFATTHITDMHKMYQALLAPLLHDRG